MRQLLPIPVDIDPVDAYGRLAALRPGRPGVRLNMIASVDGAASVDGRSGALGGPADKAMVATLRTLADVILVGAGTARAEGYGPARLTPAARALRRDWGTRPVPPIAVVTRSCRLDWDSAFFTEAEERPLVVTTSSAAAGERRRAAEVADVIVAGSDDVDLAGALAELAGRGHTNVIAEGGPQLAGQLATAGLLDEVCLTLAPLLTVGRAGRILMGAVLSPPDPMELRNVLEADGYLFLRYRLGARQN
ncbi:MAG TPA: pyrimidine reductase family protein [Acidimicrobiales bacterium]